MALLLIAGCGSSNILEVNLTGSPAAQLHATTSVTCVSDSAGGRFETSFDVDIGGAPHRLQVSVPRRFRGGGDYPVAARGSAAQVEIYAGSNIGATPALVGLNGAVHINDDGRSGTIDAGVGTAAGGDTGGKLNGAFSC